MYCFRNQIQSEMERIDIILKHAEVFDRDLLKEVFFARELQSGKVLIYSDKSRTVNGIREREYKPVGKSTDAFVWKVAEAKYMDKLLESLEKDKALLEKMLKQYRPYGREDIINRLAPVYGKTIIGDRPVRIVEGEAGQEWAAGQKWHNPKEFTSKHFTVTGTPVRSKNEAIIYNLYWHYGVPVRYEDRLVLRDEAGRKVELYPDFSILRADGRVAAHEHAGMLGNAGYRESFTEKVGIYLASGYTLWDDLFVTADGPNGSIDTALIDEMIRTFVLPKI